MIEINIWFFIITALILVLGNIILMLKIIPSNEEDKARWAWMKGEGPDPYKEKHKDEENKAQHTNTNKGIFKF